LELHPDRNYGDVENATAKFAEVQSAYELLSDPQERAWYDSHRDSILRGDAGQAEDNFEHNVRLTSAADIVNLIGKFNASVPFTDAPNGFYGILRETFVNLANEEDSACDWEGVEAVKYPDFGAAKDDYEDLVKPFYRVWMNFSTKKTFSWRDAYRSSDAPDRATRRLIDKENKRLRDEGIREFNDAVRSLVAFVRKRDPRFIPNSQTEADRQKILRDAAAAQAARSRAANQAKLKEHIIPDWAQSQQPADEGHFTDSEESEVEHIECVACGKIFKSEKQYETHEKSKKHIRAVQQLRREMRKENERLNLDSPIGSEPDVPVSEFDNLEIDSKDISSQNHTGQRVSEVHSFKEANVALEVNPAVDFDDAAIILKSEEASELSDIDDEYAPRQEIENRLGSSLSEKVTQEMLNDSTAATSVANDADGAPRLGKAKLKRAKKKAKQESQEVRQ